MRNLLEHTVLARKNLSGLFRIFYRPDFPRLTVFWISIIWRLTINILANIFLKEFKNNWCVDRSWNFFKFFSLPNKQTKGTYVEKYSIDGTNKTELKLWTKWHTEKYMCVAVFSGQKVYSRIIKFTSINGVVNSRNFYTKGTKRIFIENIPYSISTTENTTRTQLLNEVIESF